MKRGNSLKNFSVYAIHVMYFIYLIISPVLGLFSSQKIMSYGIITGKTVKANYTIYTDGVNIYARNETTGEIVYNGTNANMVINYALNALSRGRTWKEKIILDGNFIICDTIRLPSYTILEIRGRLLLSNNTNKPVISNSDRFAGNTQIEIIGGKIDGNWVQNTEGANVFGIQFQKVTDSIINNVNINNTYNSALVLYDCENVRVTNVRIVTRLSTGAAGILVVDSNNIEISSGSIIAGDDALAISAENKNVENITVSNISLFSYRANGIRINQADSSVARNETRFIRKVNISNVRVEGALGTYSKGLTVLYPSASGSYFEDSVFTNITIHNIRGKDGVYLKNVKRIMFATLIVYDVDRNGIDMEDMNIEDVVINNLIVKEVAKEEAGHGINIGDITHQAKKITINSGILENATALGANGIRLRNAVNCTIQNTIIKNFTCWGIIEFEPSDYNYIIGNDVRNNKAGGIFIVGPHTVKINNKE